jgi:predicted nucleotidyltransferase
MDARVGAAFNRFYELITPSEQQVERALEHVEKVATKVREMPSVRLPRFVRYRVMGSYARRTAIRGHSDVDVMLEFERVTPLELLGSHTLLTGLRETLGQVEDSTVQVYEFQEVVRLEYSDGIFLDLLPAVKGDRKGYLFPDGSDGWRVTDPYAQEGYFKRQDIASEICLPKFTRGLKQWNAKHGGMVRSYHLESLAAELAPQLSSDYSIASFEFFELASRSINITDPARHQGDLSEYIAKSGREAFRSLCKASAGKSLSALIAQSEGEQGRAVRAWGDVYGRPFPE